jgi:hypothetical protein
MKRVVATYGSTPQMSSAEFHAALKRHGFRVVRAKIEDATGKCQGVSWSAVLRGRAAIDYNKRSRKSSPLAIPSLPGAGLRKSSKSRSSVGVCHGSNCPCAVLDCANNSWLDRDRPRPRGRAGHGEEVRTRRFVEDDQRRGLTAKAFSLGSFRCLLRSRRWRVEFLSDGFAVQPNASLL